MGRMFTEQFPDLLHAIDPRDTRPMLIKGLRQLAKKQKNDRSWKKHGNIPL